MIVYTREQIAKKIEKFTDKYTTFTDAAAAIGCSKSQLSNARNNVGPVAPSILKAIGVERVSVYASSVEDKYRE
jgi:hypothetical protein